MYKCKQKKKEKRKKKEMHISTIIHLEKHNNYVSGKIIVHFYFSNRLEKKTII